MITVVGASVASVLALLGALHVYWACGGAWASRVSLPESDGRPLFVPGAAASLSVAFLLLAASAIVLGQIGALDGLLPSWVSLWGTRTLAVAFLGRAVGDRRWVGFFKKVRHTRFARWDTWLFSPLCLALALGCGFLAGWL